MMKFIHKLTIVLALGGICGLAACSDDDQGFLKRNLREMSFPYVESSDTFTIRATGDWQISDTPDSREWTNAYGWVHVDQLSGKGDPGTYQKVTVTCDQNTSEERNATIYLHGCGEENVAIAIRQDNGIFEWKPFDNGQQFDVSGMLKLNAEAGAKLRIPYIKALGTEKYTVTVTQTGGEGITAASGSYSISAAGNGYIEVPLTGTATTPGHRDLRREGYRRGRRGEGLRLRFDHRPRRVRRPGRGASPADAELRQIPLGRRLHRPEGGCHDGRQDRGQPEPRQRDGERLRRAPTPASAASPRPYATATRHSTAPSAWRDGRAT